jgi:hypothetical protein
MGGRKNEATPPQPREKLPPACGYSSNMNVKSSLPLGMLEPDGQKWRLEKVIVYV